MRYILAATSLVCASGAVALLIMGVERGWQALLVAAIIIAGTTATTAVFETPGTRETGQSVRSKETI